MIIPNKYSGYQAGIRLYPSGGGGGGGPASAPSAPPPPPDRMASAAPAPAFQTYGQGDRTGSLVQAGGGMRPSQLDYSKPIYDPNYADNITGYQQSSQFYQPIYQSQYQNYNMGNPMSVSQYGQQPSYGGGYGGGFGGGFGGSYGGGYPDGLYRTQMQSPFSGGNMTGIGMGGSGAGGNDFGNMLGRRLFGDQFQGGQSAGFAPGVQQGLSGMMQQLQPAQETMSNLQNAPQASGNLPALQQSYSGQEAVNMGLGYGGGGGFMPQMQSPFSFQQQVPYASQPPQGNYFSEMQRQYAQPGQDYRTVTQQQIQSSMSYQQPMQQAQPNYGPSQAIIGRSSQMRGTPNVMRRAEGGIASLMDGE